MSITCFAHKQQVATIDSWCFWADIYRNVWCEVLLSSADYLLPILIRATIETLKVTEVKKSACTHKCSRFLGSVDVQESVVPMTRDSQEKLSFLHHL